MLDPKMVFIQWYRENTRDTVCFRICAYREGSRSTFCLLNNEWVETPEMQVLPEPTFRIDGPAGRLVLQALKDGPANVEEMVEWRASK